MRSANSNKIFHHKEASASLPLEKVILSISNDESVDLNKTGYMFAWLLGSDLREGKKKYCLIIQVIEMVPHGSLKQTKTTLRYNESILL